MYNEIVASGSLITDEPTLAAITALDLASNANGHPQTYLALQGVGITMFGADPGFSSVTGVKIKTYSNGDPEALILYENGVTTSTALDASLSADSEPAAGDQFTFTIYKGDGTVETEDFDPTGILNGSAETTLTDLRQSSGGPLEEEWITNTAGYGEDTVYFNDTMTRTPVIPTNAAATPVNVLTYDYSDYQAPLTIAVSNNTGTVRRALGSDSLNNVTDVIGNGAGTVLVETRNLISVPVADANGEFSLSINGHAVDFSDVGTIASSLQGTTFRVTSATSSFNLQGTGAGNVVDYSALSGGVTVNLDIVSGHPHATGPNGTILTDIQSVNGTYGNDVIYGSVQGGVLDGMGGQDTLYGEGGYTTFMLHNGTTVYTGNGLSAFYYGGELLAGGSQDANGNIFDSYGNQYVFDTLNNSVSILFSGGGSATVYGNLLYNPAQIPNDTGNSLDTPYYDLSGIQGNPNSENNPTNNNYVPPQPAGGQQHSSLDGTGSGTIPVTFTAGGSSATFDVTPATLVFNPTRAYQYNSADYVLQLTSGSYSTVDGSTPSAYLGTPSNAQGSPFTSGGYGQYELIYEDASTSGDFETVSVPVQVNATLPEQQPDPNNPGSTEIVDVPESQTVDVSVSGKVYQAAVASVASNTVNLGVLHVGDIANGSFVFSNIASGALTDTLTVTPHVQAYDGIISMNAPTGIAAGSSGTMSFSFGSIYSGDYYSPVSVTYWSHDSDQQDVNASSNANTINVDAEVYEYAAPKIISTGAGALTSLGNSYILNLGTIAPDSGPVDASFEIENAATGMADNLGGSFTISVDEGFTNTGFGTFSNIGAYQYFTSSQVAFDPTQVGSYEETITLAPTSSDADGYSGTLADTTLTILASVGATLGSSFAYSGGVNWAEGTSTFNTLGLQVWADGAPDQTWTLSEDNNGNVVIRGLQYTGATTLTNIQAVAFGNSDVNSHTTYDLLSTSAPDQTLTVATPMDGSIGSVVVDGPSTSYLTFDSADTSYWHTGSGNTYADLQGGKTEIYMQGPESNYAYDFDGVSTLSVIDTTGANGIKTVAIDGGTGELVFGDGSTVALGSSTYGNTDVLQYGGTAGQTLNGSSGDDQLYTGKNGTVIGNGGNDTYLFGAGDGSVNISNGVSSNANATGRANFLGNVTDQDLWFAQSGNNLVVDILGTTDSMTINNWYSHTASQVSEFVDAGGLKLDSAIQDLVQAMATFVADNNAFNPQTTGTTMPTGATLQNTLAASWHS